MNRFSSRLGLSWALLAVVALAPWGGGCGRKKEAGTLENLVEEGFRLEPEEFHRAIMTGEVEVVRRFLDGGFGVDSPGDSGDPPLITAIRGDKPEVLALLLERGADPNGRAADGSPALNVAAMAGRATLVGKLLEAGARVDQRDPQTMLPLVAAAVSGSLETVEALAARAPRQVDVAFMVACLYGDVEVVDFLYDRGANLFQRTSNGDTPLILATVHGHLDVVRYLLERGVDRYSLDAQGRPAGWHATQQLAAAVAQRRSEGELEPLRQLDALLNRPPEEDLGLVAAADATKILAGWSSGESAVALAPLAGAEVAAGPVAPGAAAEAGAPAPATPVESEAQRIAALAARGEGGRAGDEGSDGGRPEAGDAAGEGGADGGDGEAGEGTDDDPDHRGVRAAGPALVLEESHSASVPLLFVGDGAAAGSARLRLLFEDHREVEVATGAEVPGTRFELVGIRRETVPGEKDSNEGPTEEGLLLLRDRANGEEIRLRQDRLAPSREPWALLRDPEGRRLMARQGDRFRSGGEEWEVLELRDGQVLLREGGGGTVVTVGR